MPIRKLWTHDPRKKTVGVFFMKTGESTRNERRIQRRTLKKGGAVPEYVPMTYAPDASGRRMTLTSNSADARRKTRNKRKAAHRRGQ